MNEKNEVHDEMQRAGRNRVGNQMFHITFWSILLINALYGTGWLAFSFRTAMVIVAAMGMAIYFGRLFALSAILPATMNDKKEKKIFIAIFIIMCVVIIANVLFWEISSLITAMIGFVTAVIGTLIPYIRRKRG